MGYSVATIDDRTLDETAASPEAAPVATCLKISVLHHGRAVVQVSFPAFAIANLADLVPQEVKPRIRAQAIDLEALASRHVAQGCPPGELFTLTGKPDTVRVWLE